VAGAVHLPPAGHTETATVIAGLRAAPLVVVYDADASCTRADEVAARLKDEGLPDVRVLSGAWPGWEAARGPGASGSCVECGDAAPGGKP
jgi:3-mercaptopyruvate sulfurtransferase SseA